MSGTGPSEPERFADDQRRYRLESRIATGGMGEVWRGADTQLGRQVAIKLLKTEYADDPTFRSRFVTEARHAASLHHPGVASVYDFGEAGSPDGSGLPRPFLVMELVDGQPLSNLLRGGRPLDPAAVRDLLAQAADAIGAAHRAGIVHRDVKPANLLVTPDRNIKITDFGIARASDGLGLTGTGQVMGTPQYLSPEQARGGTATPASDVYSLGVVGFECLAGHRPFDADSPVATALAHLNAPIPDLPTSVPTDLAAVVRRAMAKDPGDRFADGAAFAAALRDPAAFAAETVGATEVVPMPPVSERTQALLSTPAAPFPVPDPTPTPAEAVYDGYDTDDRRRSAWPIALLLVALAVVATVIVVLLTTGDDDPSATDSPTQKNTRTRSSEPTRSESSATSESSPETFNLDPGDYIGRDVDAVAADLRALGLGVDTQSVENPGGREADTVESLSPTRGLTKGETVTVRYFDEPEPSEPTSQTPPTSPTAPTDAPTSPPASSSPSPASGPDSQTSGSPSTVVEEADRFSSPKPSSQNPSSQNPREERR